MLSLRSGDPLDYREYKFFIHGTKKSVVLLSQSMQKKLFDWIQKGYQVESASVRFIVAWKSKDEPKGADETAVLLPDIVLKKEAVSENENLTTLG